MSVATEFAPVVHVPARARSSLSAVPRVYSARPVARWSESSPTPLAAVVTLRAPSPASVAPRARLTRRGAVVVSVAVAVLAGALVWLAALSAPAPSAAHAAVPGVVTVQQGDTLWSLASRTAPDRDPRAEVERLKQLNHLSGVGLDVGQVLRTR